MTILKIKQITIQNNTTSNSNQTKQYKNLPTLQLPQKPNKPIITHHSTQILILLISSLNPTPKNKKPLITSSIPLNTQIKTIHISIITIFN